MTLVTVHEDNRLRVTTPCTSVMHFITELSRYVEDDTLFVPMRGTYAPGVEVPFVVVLADGAPVMNGTASVREIWETSDNPFELPGILLSIERLTGEGWEVLRNIQRHRAGTLVSLAPPPPHSQRADLEIDSDEVVDGVPLLLDTESTSRGPEPEFQPVKRSTLVIPPPPRPPARTSSTRTYVCPVPRQPTPVPGVQAAMADDLFSMPTRVSTQLPRTLLLDDEPKLRRSSSRPYRLWAGASALALLASVGIVRATETDRNTQTVAASRPEPVVVRREAALPIVGTGACRLSVLAVPAGATVELDGVPQGVSPLTLATTCGQHRIDLSHLTHARLSVLGTLVEGQPEMVDVTLARRIDAVSVVSRPLGATIYIDGRPIGRTPKRIDVLGHVPLTLEIRKPGYQPVVEHVYSTTPRNKFAVLLTPDRPRAVRKKSR